MIEQLKQENKVVGAKQTRRALKDHRAKRVYMAQDADPRILQPLVQEAVRQQVPLEQVDMELLLEKPQLLMYDCKTRTELLGGEAQ